MGREAGKPHPHPILLSPPFLARVPPNTHTERSKPKWLWENPWTSLMPSREDGAMASVFHRQQLTLPVDS